MRKGILGASLLLTLQAQAQPAVSPATSISAATRPRIAIVLSGGGARGLAHVGVFKALEKLRIPYDATIRSDLRSVTKQTTAAGNIRFTAERTPDGHADRFWALALAVHAAATPAAPIEFQSTGRRAFAGDGGGFTSSGFGSIAGGNDFEGFL